MRLSAFGLVKSKPGSKFDFPTQFFGLRVACRMVRPAPLLERVCAAFPLGEPLAPWRRVSGGLSNELRRLETTAGCFAVKRMVVGTEFPWFRGNVEASFQIEQAAVDAGIRAPRPISAESGEECLAEIECEGGDSCWVRVHEWKQGNGPDHRTAPPRFARQIGQMVASIHALEVPLLGEVPPVEPYGGDVWHGFAERARPTANSWASEFRALLPTVDRLEGLIRHHPSQPSVPGHRDADDKNTLISDDGELWLIDWDAAGAVDPGQELTSVLLDWSGARSGHIRMEMVRAIRDGYALESGANPALDPSGWITDQLGWLHLNLRRALGDLGPEEASLGERELIFLANNLGRIAGSMEEWMEEWEAG